MKFNPKQKKILKVGIVIVLLMVAIPPWNYTFTYSKAPAGYSFIALPPLRKVSKGQAYGGITVNGSRLLVQLIVTIAATYVGIMLTAKKED
jgi:hypothetical protein